MEIKNKLNTWSNVDHMYKRVKKKKCKKNIFYLIFLISISLLDNAPTDTPNSESINKENNKLDNETNSIKENNFDSKINENVYNTNNKIRNELLFQSFNIRSFEEERYKLKF
ncbi:hypothetical protein, partial [Plasmodium yoelii yoelii]